MLFRFIGSTTVLTSDPFSIANSGDNGRWRANIDVVLVGSKAAQRVSAFVTGCRSSSASLANISQFTLTGYGVATEDMNSAQAMALTIAMSVASANSFMTLNMLTVEEITE